MYDVILPKHKFEKSFGSIIKNIYIIYEPKNLVLYSFCGIILVKRVSRMSLHVVPYFIKNCGVHYKHHLFGQEPGSFQRLSLYLIS